MVDITSNRTLLMHAPKDSHRYKNQIHTQGKVQASKFTFSRIFEENTSQKVFFDNTMLPAVKTFLSGQNSLLFTYGVTNSGKTYTMQGEPKNPGVMPRSLDVIFNSIGTRQWLATTVKPFGFCSLVDLSKSEIEQEQKLKEDILKMADIPPPLEDDSGSLPNASSVPDSSSEMNSLSSFNSKSSIVSSNADDEEGIRKFLEEEIARERESSSVELDNEDYYFAVYASYAEIYNEFIYDLLSPVPKKRRRTALRLTEDKKKLPYIRGLREVQITNAEEAAKLLIVGKKNLKFACTKLNQHSSRSHGIFTIRLVRIPKSIINKQQLASSRSIKVNMLAFCDLAGAERSSKTEAVGVQLKESGNINTSLLALGRCITQLKINQKDTRKKNIVPFRDSKLTRLFQNFFCGNGSVTMIVNINQSESVFDETLHALKFSAIAQEVVLVQNQEPKPLLERLARTKSADITVPWGSPATIAAHMDPKNFGIYDETDETDIESENSSLNHYRVSLDEAEATPKCHANNTLNTLDCDGNSTLTVDEMLILFEKLEKDKEKKEEEFLLDREKLCKNYDNLIKEIEERHEQDLIDLELRLETKYEQKIENVVDTVKKPKKRRCLLNDSLSDTSSHDYETQIDDLKNKINDLELQLDNTKTSYKNTVSENENLNAALTKFELQFGLQRKENEDMKKQIKFYEEKLIAERNSNTETEKNCKILNKNNLELSEEIKSLVLEKEELLEKIKVVRKEIENSMVHGDDKNKKITSLESIISEKEIADAKKCEENRQLQNQISVLKEELLNVQQLYDSKSEETINLKKDLAAFESVADRKASESGCYKEKVEQLEALISENQLKFDEKIKSMETDFSTNQLDYKTQIKELENTLSDSRTISKQKFESLESEFSEKQENLKQKIESLQKQLSEEQESSNQIIENLKKQLAEKQDYSERKTEDFERQFSEKEELYHKKIEYIENQLTEKEEFSELAIQNLKIELSDKEESSDKKIKDLECQLSESQENLARATEDLKRQITKNKEDSKQEIKVLENQLLENQETAKQRIEYLEGELSQKQTEYEEKITNMENSMKEAQKIYENQLKDLENKLVEKEAESQKSSQIEIKNLHDRLEETQQDNDRKIKELENTFSQKETNLKEKICSLESKLFDSEDCCKDFSDENEILKNQLNKFEKDGGERNVENEELKKTIADLKEKLLNSRALCKSSDVDKEVLTERVEELKTTLKQKTDQNDQLTKTVAKLEADFNELNAINHDSIEKIDGLKRGITKLESELDNSEKENDELSRKLKDTEEELNSSKSLYVKTIEENKSLIEDMKSRELEYNEKLKTTLDNHYDIEKLLDELRNEQEENHRLEETIKSRDEELKKLESGLKDQDMVIEDLDLIIDQKTEDIKSLNERIDSLSEELNSFKNSHEFKNAEVLETKTRLQNEIDEMNNKIINDRKKYNDLCEKLKNERDKFLMDSKVFEAESSRLESENQDLKTKLSNMEVSETKVHNSEETVLALKKKFKALEEKCTVLKERNEQLKEENKSLDENTTKFRSEKDLLVRQIETIMKEKDEKINLLTEELEQLNNMKMKDYQAKDDTPEKPKPKTRKKRITVADENEKKEKAVRKGKKKKPATEPITLDLNDSSCVIDLSSSESSKNEFPKLRPRRGGRAKISHEDGVLTPATENLLSTPSADSKSLTAPRSSRRVKKTSCLLVTSPDDINDLPYMPPARQRRRGKESAI
ncbi:DgyrCDS12031 [Dimorphilus gyrociliatus]|uniref:DgyrCDS12031 n=1 Tax=Dimorphilus gyrociliatus TaxID=2664684 RepID=A0A7I8W8G0_9ANNE|nr:DgyrCDS12031 [Dimorphilus gyrociliatus]